MPLLVEQKRQHSMAGRAPSRSCCCRTWRWPPILVTIAFLGSHQDNDFSFKPLMAFALAALGLLGLVALGRLVLRPMMRSVARADSPELFMAASLLVVIGAGLAAAMVGLSMALGAFIAGLLLAETEHRKQIERTVEPFKGLLLGLFFVSVGISLDLSRLAAAPVLIVDLMVGVMTLNGAIVFGLARLWRLRRAAALETALPAGRRRRVLIRRPAVGHDGKAARSHAGPDDPRRLNTVDVRHSHARGDQRRRQEACPGGQPDGPRTAGSASRDLKRSREKSRCKGRSAARGEKKPGDAPDKRCRPSPPLVGGARTMIVPAIAHSHDHRLEQDP